MTERDKEPRFAPPLFHLPPQEETLPTEKESADFEEFSWYWSLASKGKINRRVVLGLMGGFLGGLSFLLSRGLQGVATAQEKDNRVATALFAEGVLTVIRPDGSKKRLAGQGALPLYEGDKLQTGRVSQGYILFQDGTSMALNANTTLIIRSRKDAKGTVQTIKLLIGEIWAQIGEKTKRFEIETPNALAAVSGTEFGEGYDEEVSTLTVGEGEMDFGTRSTEEQSLDEIPGENRKKVPAGYQSRIEKRGRPTDLVMVDTERILNWGRSLNARFRPRKAKMQRGGTSRPGRLPRRRDTQPQEPSGPSGSRSTSSQPY